MENQTVNVTLGENNHHAEVVVRHGVAEKLIEPKPPVNTNLSGTIGVPLEYLAKRIATGQFTQERSHLSVDRENIKLILVINENDEYERGTVTGKLEFNPKFIEFGINTGKAWTPNKLGMFFKMNRAFFPDRETNMRLVTELMNFTATVNAKIDRSLKESGDRTDAFMQTVNSNLPPSFTLKMQIFKGTPEETIEVETFANVDAREVSFFLISPSANQALEDIRNNVIDYQLEKIRGIAPNLAIIEV